MSRTRLGAKPLLFPQPAVLVGAVVDGRPNYMLAAWCGVANHTPPILSLAVRPGRHTNRGIHAHREFSVNVPSSDQMVAADHCGIVSGARRDKSGVFATEFGTLAGAPLIRDCPVSLECRLLQTVTLATHELHLGEIVEVHAAPECLVDGVPDMGRVDPLLYAIAEGRYWSVGQPLGKAFQVGRQWQDG